MKTIVIRKLTTAEIDKALKELEEYKRWVKKKVSVFMQRLKDEGLTDLSVRWASTLYDGIDASQLSAEDTANGFNLMASGQAVCFIEFGTGVHFNGSGSYPGEKPEGVVDIGMYGYGYGKHDYWFYHGDPNFATAGGTAANGKKNTVITHGNPANAHMYNTTKWIKENFVRIAKEVFTS